MPEDIKPVGKLVPLIPKQDIKPVGSLKPLNADASYLEATGQATPAPDPKIKEVWGRPKEEKNDEGDGFGSLALKALESASAYIGSSVAKTPGFIYDTFAAPFNYVASGRLKDDLSDIKDDIAGTPKTGEEQAKRQAAYKEFDDNHAAKSDYFKELVKANTNPGSLSQTIFSAPEKVAEHYDKVIEENHKATAEKYGAGVDEEFNKGNYGNAFKLLALSTIESVPVTATMMLGNAAGVTARQATQVGGAIFGAAKKAQLDQEFPDMPEGQKLAASWLNGLSEGYIENSFGLTKLGGEIGNLFAKGGMEAGKKIAEEGFKDVYLPVLKKYAGNFTEEVGSEMTTQYVQNAIDKYVGGDENKNLMDGVIDAGLSAGLMSGPIVGLTGAAELSQTKKGIKQGIVERDAAQGKHALEVAQGGDEAVKNFKANVNEELAKGNLTPEEANKAITRINAYKEYNDITTTLDLPEEKKLEIFDKTFQKQVLETELESYGDPSKLHPLKQGEYAAKEKMANDIQKDINAIMLETQVKKEPVIGDKTINDLAKKEQKETEVKKPSEKEKKISEGLKAFKEKFKDKLPKEDTRTFEEIPAQEYNGSGINNRLKHKKTVEYLERQPEKTVFGKVVEREFSHDGKTNSVLGIDVNGKKLRFASSMLREEGYRGHFRQEQFENEFPEGTDVGMKVEEIPAFEEGLKPKKVIKAFRADNGKFIGWMKETTRGTSDYSPEQQDALAHLETVIEPHTDLFNEAVSNEPTNPVIQPELSPMEVKDEYHKPDLNLNVIEDSKILKDNLGKASRKTSKGDVVEANMSAGKKQAEIKAEHDRLKKLVNCIWD